MFDGVCIVIVRLSVCEAIYFGLYHNYVIWRVFFFFQAEDGIRDYKVTGVQTCALPICLRLRSLQLEQHADRSAGRPASLALDAADQVQPFLVLGVGCVAEVRAKGASASVQQGADDGKVAAQGPSVAWRRPRMVPLEVLVPYMPRAPDARKPPSTGIAMPVTYRASSDTK